MKNRLPLVACALGLLTGCLTSAPKAPDNWTIEMDRAKPRVTSESGLKLPVVRVAAVSVRAPYDGTRLAVLRPDGSLAFDGYNTFAAAPAFILRGAVQDALEAMGATVVPSASSAQADHSLETTVTRLALDCRREGRRDAVVALTVALLDNRRVEATGRGEGRAATGSGDYSAAFSEAFAAAMTAAVRAAASAASGR